MKVLNLPFYKFNIKISENKRLIFDQLRKKYVVLTPEEWVRQHFISYLLSEKKYPASLIAIEKELKINGLKKRTDILIFNKKGFPNIIVECKAPSVPITQNTFDQIARYNLKLNASFLIVTNGLQHFYCQMDHENQQYVFLKDIPNYSVTSL
jgi:hypothetical protein